MKIDFFRVLENNLNNHNRVNSFIKEISKKLELIDNEKSPEEIKKENKLSLISENRIIIENDRIKEKYKNKPYKAKTEMIKMAKRVLKKQNEKLLEHRKEGHLYMVEEDVRNRIYLRDLSVKTGKVFEEVDFPKDLMHYATEGAVFKYENGTYHFQSYNGFEMLYND